MLNLLPPGRTKRALIVTAALAIVAQGLSEVALTCVKILKELLPLIAGGGYKF
jgi:hypothetical protein